MRARVGVLLAEPDAPTRVGIRLALDAAGLEVCCEPLTAASAVDDAVSRRPDVCLIDDRLPGGALVAVEEIYRRVSETKLLMLTNGEKSDDLLAAILAGAAGYLRTDRDPARLPSTIRGVLDGEAALSRRLTFRLIESLRVHARSHVVATRPGGPAMTDRELEVLELMTQGLRTNEIAARLFISEVTVRRHISSAVSKLGVADRAGAIAVLSGRSPL